jgi:CDP-diacylglycerol--serine O-phosphatidyltransferase
MARALVMMEQPVFQTHPHPRLLFVAPILFSVCAILRLARFNTDAANQDRKLAHDTFVGLPTPAAAGLPTAMILFYFNVRDPDFFIAFDESSIHAINEIILRIMPYALILMSLLMVSRVPYPHFFSWLTRSRNTFRAVAETAIVFALLLVEPALSLLCAAFCFIGVPLVKALPGMLREVRHRRSSSLDT